MAVPAGVMRCTMQARLGGSEVALFGFHLQLVDPPAIDDADLQGVADKVKASWLDAYGTKKDLFSQALTMEAVRIDLLDNTAGPHYLKTTAVALSEFAPSGTGSFIGSGAVSLPWECALVISLAAYPPNGFALNQGRRRGRYYLPALPSSIIATSEGQLPSSATDAYADAAQDFHETINDIVQPAGVQLQTVVLSRADDSVYRVQHLWVDSKVDSQRRRENKQPAAQRATRTLDP